MLFKYLSFCMGLACNKHCSYCFRQHHSKPEIPVRLTPAFKEWLLANSMKYKRAVFVGGEPLLYMQGVREVTACLPDYMQKLVITNGTLLTNALVDYFNANNFEVLISYDGPLTKKLRGYDVLDGKVDLIRKIKKLGFQSVITSRNINLTENHQYICERIGRKDFYYSLNFYMDTGPQDSFIKDFDYKMLRKYLVDMYTSMDNREHSTVSEGNRNYDGLLGTQLLLNGDVVQFQSFKRYGSVFDDEQELRKAVMKDRGKCDCLYDSICTMKRQIKTEHLCKMYQANMQAAAYLERRGNNEIVY